MYTYIYICICKGCFQFLFHEPPIHFLFHEPPPIPILPHLYYPQKIIDPTPSNSKRESSCNHAQYGVHLWNSLRFRVRGTFSGSSLQGNSPSCVKHPLYLPSHAVDVCHNGLFLRMKPCTRVRMRFPIRMYHSRM